VTVLHWPGMRSEYAVLAAHDSPTMTGPGEVGIAFSGHRRLPWESGGRSAVADIAPGSAIVTGAEPIAWLRVREPTEALEIYPAPELLASLVGAAVPAAAGRPAVVGAVDGVVLGIGSVLRRVHATGGSLSDVAASMLAHRLAAQVLSRYAGVPVAAGPGPGTLPARSVDRVAEYVDSALHDQLTIDALARVASLSPFHFARAFRNSTGLTPYGFVTSRRMDRARHLLRTGGEPVDAVARAVGFSNISHFRRTFRRHAGCNPSALRARDSKMRPSGRRPVQDKLVG
jgi:AraC family transcriptional regulator